jgi:VWFA-related protein
MSGMKRLALACVAATLASAAQNPPMIRVDTRLVQVDVTVRTGKGPVRGLTKDDFTLFERGKAQQIALFKVTESHPQASDEIQALPLGVVSNRLNQRGEALGSVTVILVDRLNTPPTVQPFADRELLRFLQSAQKGDRIAIYTLDQQIRVVQDFTTDLDRLIRAASKINLDRPMDLKSFELMKELAAAGADTTPLQEMANLVKVDRATGTSQALSLIAKHLAGVPGRKNLIWISSSFPLTISEKGLRRDFVPEIQKATRMLNDANVVVYPVDARGLMTSQGPVPVQIPVGPSGGPPNNFVLAGSDPSEGVDTMNTVAAWTGGQAYYNTNDLKGAIRQAINDAEVTYTLGFYAPQGALDGSFHDLRVKVRGGGDVRARKGYFASVEAAPTEKQRMDALRQLFGNPLDATGVGLTAGPLEDTPEPGVYRLALTVELSDLHLQQMEDSWEGSIDVGFSFESAKPPGFRVTTLPIHLAQDRLKAALEHGIVVQETIDARGATGRLRVAVQDQATGAAGSVWVSLGTK